MKQTKVLNLVAVLIAANLYVSAQQVPKTKAKVSPKLVITAAEAEKGGQLIMKSDCFACHKKDEKLVGPSYKQIADKYALVQTDLDLLSRKVRDGGTGAWGQIPMSPHPTLPEADVNLMVKYIMSLKNSK